MSVRSESERARTAHLLHGGLSGVGPQRRHHDLDAAEADHQLEQTRKFNLMMVVQTLGLVPTLLMMVLS